MAKQRKADAEEKMSIGVAHAMSGEKVNYPSILNLDEGNFKEIGECKVGDTYEFSVKAKCVALSSAGDLAPWNDSDQKEIHGKFEVIKAEYEDEDDKEEGEKE